MVKRPEMRAHCTAFAAGVLLTVIITHVVPESLGQGSQLGGTLILAGFIGMVYLQQKVLKADPCCGHEHAKHAGLPSYLAMVACSVNDGVILTTIGKNITHPLLWAMCVHKLTSSFALVMLLRETSGDPRGRLTWLYLLVFVVITPVVVLVGSLDQLQNSMDYLVPLGAGALLYVICGGMVPRVEHLAQEGRQHVLSTFIIGAVVTIVVELVVPHHPILGAE
jgi:zinc transporter ZupT